MAEAAEQRAARARDALEQAKRRALEAEERAIEARDEQAAYQATTANFVADYTEYSAAKAERRAEKLLCVAVEEYFPQRLGPQRSAHLGRYLGEKMSRRYTPGQPGDIECNITGAKERQRHPQ